MSSKLFRPSATKGSLPWQMAAFQYLAKADPDLDCQEMGRVIDALLPTLPPVPRDMPTTEESWDALRNLVRGKKDGTNR